VDDFKPFLQIVHISDLHVTDPKSPHAARVRSRIRKWRRVSAGFANWLEEGTSPHDALAVAQFADFLRELVKDPLWAGCETWLLDTGDLTSLGDAESFRLGRHYLASLTRICPKVASIYGNHDAWPGEPPLLARRKAIGEQWKVVVNQGYRVATARCALRANIPHGRGQVQLYFVDSVIHDRWRNGWALGEISQTQLRDLQGVVDQDYDPERFDLRILAVHHPIHYPPPRPAMAMVMRNDNQVAATLDTKSPAGAYPLMHLVLSGHTHSLYPDQGALPTQASLCVHNPLQSQVQLVVGTLMQLDRYETRAGWPHQCQILRFYYSPSDSALVSLERLLAARQSGSRYRGAGIGPYKIVPVPPLSHETAEEITFAL
jgi:3',5'-cyclic AMP phosphodiesterase CpdA